MIIFMLSLILGKEIDEVSYVRYFESDFNFKADLSMLSSERRGKNHLAVGYNELNQPIKIEQIAHFVDLR